MKILITGGAGFIGSHICERLLKKDYEVVCLDSFDSYYDPNLKWNNIRPFLNNKKFRLVKGNILNRKLVRELVKQDVDYVFHYAAQAGVRASVENPVKTHKANSEGILNILQACVSSQVKGIINASSSSVYGKIHYLPLDEKHSTMPISPYGVSKLSAEHYCRVFHEIYGLSIISLRLFTVYGAKMRPDLAISIFTHKALNNEAIEIFGDGSKTRDFTYVDDVVSANMLAMENGCGKVYNIGSGARINIETLARRIIEIAGSKSEIVHTFPIKGDAEDTKADIRKAAEELGYKPQVDLNQGLQQYIEREKSLCYQ